MENIGISVRRLSGFSDIEDILNANVYDNKAIGVLNESSRRLFLDIWAWKPKGKEVLKEVMPLFYRMMERVISRNRGGRYNPALVLLVSRLKGLTAYVRGEACPDE